MDATRLRRLLFDRLFPNLALLLGLAQAGVGWWLLCIGLGWASPPLLGVAAAAALLVAANARVVPLLRGARRRRDWPGWLARSYADLGIATLLVAATILGSSAVLLLGAGLLGSLAGPDTAFGLYRGGSIAAVGAAALLLANGFTFGQARCQRTRLAVPVPGLAPALDGLRIVQISDLHIGNHMEGPRLSRWIEKVNALRPDLVALTGDIFDHDPGVVEDGARRLGALRARLGVFAVLGNHDHYVGAEQVARALRRWAPGMRLLRDEIAALPTPAPLYLAGAEDPVSDWSARDLFLPGLQELAGRRPPDGPTLLLVHRPEAFGQAARLGFPLVLSGHTHGGQLALPGAGGRYNLARLVSGYTRGLYRASGSTLYVNRGLGVGGPPLRIYCSREIATLVLRSPRPTAAPTPALDAAGRG